MSFQIDVGPGNLPGIPVCPPGFVPLDSLPEWKQARVREIIHERTRQDGDNSLPVAAVANLRAIWVFNDPVKPRIRVEYFEPAPKS